MRKQPEDNKFHVGNGGDGKHYWLTPPEARKGKDVVLVYPIDKWVLMLLAAGAEVRNLGDVRWLATEDNAPGKGTGRHIAAFILKGSEQ
jgi:hypothetical protein